MLKKIIFYYFIFFVGSSFKITNIFPNRGPLSGGTKVAIFIQNTSKINKNLFKYKVIIYFSF